MKNIKRIILPCIISFIILTINNYSLANTAKVSATAVRIRETASTDSNILINIYKEDKVEILEENGEWYKVKYGETVGYAKAEFFTKDGETQETTTPETPVATEAEMTQPEAESQNTTTDNLVSNYAETVESSEQSVVPTEENTESTIKEFNIGETINLPNSVKIRTIPSLVAGEKDEIQQGVNITVEAQLGNWYKITDQTVSGWITKSKLNTASVAVEQPAVEEQNEQVQSQPEVPQTTTSAENVENTTTEQAEQTQEAQNTTSEGSTALNKTAVVIVETARVRETPSKTSDIVAILDEDDVVTIVAEEGEFYKIKTNEISSGYISKSLVKEKDVTSRSLTEERTDTVSVEENEALNEALSQETTPSTKGSEIVEFAKQFLGYPYVLGCSSPESGFDCSGFTRYVFGNFGYKLGSVAASQTSLGAVVERENLQTGDLILFYNEAKTKIGHCGIFMENGDFIHSANPQRGVVIDNLNTNSYYSERFVTARRIAE